MSMSLENSLSDLKTSSSLVCLGDSNVTTEEFESPSKQTKCSEISNSSLSPDTSAKNDFKTSVETMIVKRLLQKAKQNFDSQNMSHHQQKHQTGSPVKKKLRRRYKSSKRKSKSFITKPISKCDSEGENIKTGSTSLPLTDGSSHLEPLTIEVENLASPNQNILLSVETPSPLLKRHSMLLGRKKFTLPIVSARSARRIFPQKRYLQEEELDISSKKNSLLDTTSGPESSNINRKKSKVISSGVNQPLVEKKRSYKKSHLSVNNLCESTNLDSNFEASTSHSDGIKLDMVSQYAAKMAEKPKERRIKNGESKRPIFKTRESLLLKKDRRELSEKKNIDPLERIAAKIEKILRSQWEGRLNPSNATSPTKSENNQQTMKAKTSPLSQWKSEQEQRACDRKRTKNLIHKAKLRLKKRTLMKLRQPQSIALLNEQLRNSQTSVISEKQRCLSSPSGIDWPTVPIELIKSPIPPKFDVPGSKTCFVCGVSATLCQVQKYYGRLACEPCSKFFGNFIETPKQYFCAKEGNCKSNIKPMKNLKVSNIRFRCKACWLKSCMQNFSVSPFLRDQLLKYVPRLETPPHDVLIEDCHALLKFSSTINFTPNVSVPKVSNIDPVSNTTSSMQEICSAGTSVTHAVEQKSTEISHLDPTTKPILEQNSSKIENPLPKSDPDKTSVQEPKTPVSESHLTDIPSEFFVQGTSHQLSANKSMIDDIEKDHTINNIASNIPSTNINESSRITKDEIMHSIQEKAEDSYSLFISHSMLNNVSCTLNIELNKTDEADTVNDKRSDSLSADNQIVTPHVNTDATHKEILTSMELNDVDLNENKTEPIILNNEALSDNNDVEKAAITEETPDFIKKNVPEEIELPIKSKRNRLSLKVRDKDAIEMRETRSATKAKESSPVMQDSLPTSTKRTCRLSKAKENVSAKAVSLPLPVTKRTSSPTARKRNSSPIVISKKTPSSKIDNIPSEIQESTSFSINDDTSVKQKETTFLLEHKSNQINDSATNATLPSISSKDTLSEEPYKTNTDSLNYREEIETNSSIESNEVDEIVVLDKESVTKTNEVPSPTKKSKDLREKLSESVSPKSKQCSAKIRSAIESPRKESTSPAKAFTSKSTNKKNNKLSPTKLSESALLQKETKTALPDIDETRPVIPKTEEVKRKGPRVKHVCRRAAVALGLPKATFGKKVQHFNLSALPQEEKQKILAASTDT